MVPNLQPGSPALEQIRQWMEEAGEAIRADQPLEVQAKSTFDFVTQVDLEVQQFLTGKLQEQYPEIACYGEEDPVHAPIQGLTWILDPVDGTSNLIHHRRYSCISLGLSDGKQLQFGAIYDPFAREFFHASLGSGAFCNGVQIHVSRQTDPARALLITSSGSSNKPLAREQMRLVSTLMQEAVDIRISGSSALNLAYMAAGRGTALISSSMKPWDAAAGILLVREAGGCVTNYSGQTISAESSSSILAANPTLHQWLREKIDQDGIVHSEAYCETFGLSAGVSEGAK